MSQKILGLSGRKQSGKNTSFNFLLGIHMLRLAVTRDKMMIKPDGKLWISDIFGDEEYAGVFDIERQNDTMRDFCSEYIWPYIRNYSFAEMLKRNACIDILGLSEEQCFGTDEQKNSLTHLKWENMPGNVKIDFDETESLGHPYAQLIPKKRGIMSAREVMQFVGTEIFRKMYPNVWPDATIKKIVKEDSLFAIITDCRFPNEVEAIQKAGGKVIRFDRGSLEDQHESENALDRENFDWNKFDAIIENKDMLISQQNESVKNILGEWGWLDGIHNAVEQ